MKILKSLQSVYEYFFAPWEITIYSRGTEKWGYSNVWNNDHTGIHEKDYIEYKYSHKFRKQEKIVKVYLN